MFDQLLTISVVLLPTLFAVAVEVVGRRIKVHPYWRVAALGFGVGISALTGLQVHRSDRAHREEVRQQHEDVDNLRTDLRQSEVELQVRDAYLRAKLESEAQFYAQLAQFAPGIKILAETSAEFARKQYEAKLVSDRELYQFTMKTVEKIRNFSQKYRTIRDREMDRVVTIASNPEISDTERQTQWNEIFERSVEVNHARYDEFHEILAGVIYAKTELHRRKVFEPSISPPIQADVNRALNGVLAGVDPELKLADYLEAWAKPLGLSDSRHGEGADP